MTDNINKIAEAELDKLGFAKKKSVADPSPPRYKHGERGRTDLFSGMTGKLDDSLTDIPDFLGPKRKKNPPPVPNKMRRTVVTGRSTPQHQDDICVEMESVGAAWKCHEKVTDISEDDLAHISNVLATNAGNILDHCGLIYNGSEAAEHLRQLIAAWITNETKHWDGKKYRDIRFVK
tara:strand:+ start:1143 stop:1673 length:531 start_codon:yes stop_codon:yes gene_type:complete